MANGLGASCLAHDRSNGETSIAWLAMIYEGTTLLLLLLAVVVVVAATLSLLEAGGGLCSGVTGVDGDVGSGDNADSGGDVDGFFFFLGACRFLWTFLLVLVSFSTRS